MRYASLALVVFLLLAGCAQPAALNVASIPKLPNVHDVVLKAISFLPPVDTDRISRGSEPSIATAPDGTIYVSAPSLVTDLAGIPLERTGQMKAQSVVFVSSDGGKSFTRTGSMLSGQNADYSGGGDSDVAVDAGGRVYMADLGVGIPVIASSDKGKSWDLTKNAASGNSTDREWVAGGRAGEVFLGYENTSENGYQYLEITNSSDGGKTWRHPATKVAQLNFPESYHGPIQFDNERRILYAPFSMRNGMGVGVSKDGGMTFDVQNVATGRTTRPGMLLPTAAIDRAGNIYEAWAEDGTIGWSIYYSWAPPGGGNWSAPHLVAGGNSVMPALIAGADGKIAVAYYHSDLYLGEPDSPAASAATWDLDVAHTLAATSDMPEFHSDVAVANVHVGSICSIGSACLLGPALGAPLHTADRSLGDFFRGTLTKDGKLAIAFDHDDPAPWTQGDTAAVVIQDGGDSLT